MGKISVWVLGDQLLEKHPAIEKAEAEVGKEGLLIVLVESRLRLQRLPYQRKKLVLLLSAMRHYSQKLQERGYQIDTLQAEDFGEGLRAHIGRFRPGKLLSMASASYAGRSYQAKLGTLLETPVELIPNTQFLVGHFDPIPDPESDKRYTMEGFYRAMRRHFQVLMQGDDPMGGRWNFDEQNRKRLPDDVIPPVDPHFEPDQISKAVMAEVARFARGIGTVEGFHYAVTHEQARQAFEHFLHDKLNAFGPYEDAMTRRSHSLFHSVLSPYLNLGLLQPMELIRSAEAAYADGLASIASVEGFVRQVLGWREFMYWQYWRQMPGMAERNAWQARRPLPKFLWTGETEMFCLRHAIERALNTGYNHHIERLMLLSNFFMLAGVNPKEVNDWFLSVYVDAYDWVMAPNVIGMGLHADGGLTATRPYIASANYIRKMGDYCAECAYDPKKRVGEDACPYNFLYWNFVLQHEDKLRYNPRTSRMIFGLRHLGAEEREAIKLQAKEFLAGWMSIN